jgi:putative transposase
MDYRRVYINGGTYFFTLVTYKRQQIFTSEKVIDLFDNAIQYTYNRMPFVLVARVILPNHVHLIMTMPEDSSDFSTRIRLIKSHFTRFFCEAHVISRTVSRIRKGERDVWQRRFWEHLIRDDNDMTRHVEYIHFNPVKHGYVKSPIDWQYSSFRQYVLGGLYPADWGVDCMVWSGESYME